MVNASQIPATSQEIALAAPALFLSSSLPQDLQGTLRAQDLNDILVSLIGTHLQADGTFVFGGHPTITPLVHRLARSLAGRGRVMLFQGEAFRNERLAEVDDQQVFPNVQWRGKGRSKLDDLNAIREAMIATATAGVFVGGKTSDNIGERPGIRVEYELFLQHHPDGPAYILGLLNGEARLMIDELESRGEAEPNGLNADAQRLVHHSDNIDLIVSLILDDIQRLHRGATGVA
ncbi:SLOG domain-containing protein [Candidatus Entotheonella palauensis]|uniref:SLOG domain-containing protein n=1 Tax=Candidatus Entotheonella palauensis TaxID=93172 RepID=UPI000B7EFA9E|nr:hypothetical protein [Candidatus Entotheonella palauensis]